MFVEKMDNQGNPALEIGGAGTAEKQGRKGGIGNILMKVSQARQRSKRKFYKSVKNIK